MNTQSTYLFIGLFAAVSVVSAVVWSLYETSTSEPVQASSNTNGKSDHKTTYPLLNDEFLGRKSTVNKGANDYKETSLTELKDLLGQYPIPSLNIDVNGNLIIDKQVPLFLEHFTHWLGLEGISPTLLYESSLSKIDALYSGDLLAQVRDLFNRYWQYNLKLSSFMTNEEINSAKAEFDGHYQSESTLSLVADYQEKRDTLRASHFTHAEKEVFFGDEDRYDAFFRQSLADGHTKNAEQLLSQEQRDQRKKTNILVNLEALESNQNLKPGSEKWLSEVESQYGTDTASRLAEVEAKKTTWQQKKADYLSLKENLNTQSSLSEQDLAYELDRIMKEDLAFSDFEMRRMQALEGRFQQQIN